MNTTESIKHLKNIAEKTYDNIDYELLEREGTHIRTALDGSDGSVVLYEYDGVEYVVLSDNTVITREEDLSGGNDEAFFPADE